MKHYCVQIGLWLARLGGWELPVPPPPDHSACAAELKTWMVGLEAEKRLSGRLAEEAREVRAACDAALHDAKVREDAAEARYRETVAALQKVSQQVADALTCKQEAEQQLLDYTTGRMDIPNAMIQKARLLTADIQRQKDLSGEAKRHQVYARMIKEFPNEERRKIGMAIEMSLPTK